MYAYSVPERDWRSTITGLDYVLPIERSIHLKIIHLFLMLHMQVKRNCHPFLVQGTAHNGDLLLSNLVLKNLFQFQRSVQ